MGLLFITVKRLPCSTLVSSHEIMRKMCSPSRNSLKVKRVITSQMETEWSGGGKRSPDFSLKTRKGRNTSAVISRERVCGRLLVSIVCHNFTGLWNYVPNNIIRGSKGLNKFKMASRFEAWY